MVMTLGIWLLLSHVICNTQTSLKDKGDSTTTFKLMQCYQLQAHSCLRLQFPGSLTIMVLGLHQ